MLTYEEAKVLDFLQRRLAASLPDIGRACLHGASRASIERVLADLEWLGYVVVFHDPTGGADTVQATERGRAWAV